MTTLPPEVLFAKHRLLPEIGIEGQRALSASSCELPSEMRENARETAREYLVRSGVQVRAIDPELLLREDASQACLAELEGALFALGQIQRILGVGAPLTISDALCTGTQTP